MLTRYRPLDDLMRDDLFDRFFHDRLGRLAREKPPQFTPAVDVVELEDQYLIKAEVPGMDPKQVEVETHDGVLTLKGERRDETEKEENGYRRIERHFGTFQRAFGLPKGVDEAAIEAKVENGLLTVRIPKPAVEKPAARKVQVKGEG